MAIRMEHISLLYKLPSTRMKPEWESENSRSFQRNLNMSYKINATTASLH